MFKRILVSLDGSDLAAQSLEPAFRIAEKFDSQVFLLRVVNPEEFIVTPAGMGAMVHEMRDSQVRREWADAEAYLDGVRLEWRGLCSRVKAEVLAGAPPEIILDRALAHGIDLIVMSTHGRSGLRRLLYGSVAEAVLRGTNLPVLLIPPER